MNTSVTSFLIADLSFMFIFLKILQADKEKCGRV